ncbi:hypothetical protein SeLEV6574_g04169 [Synchytrium endobioticum]|uniref:Nucleoporin NSP1 n=1 Tax=Synchytrium endobioticum TaxID=286115 RepID=A0A507D0P5_9FUNG|nr:hypothetical protein SeLEV6574_g04169 [Synchytrium endobioticum]
MFGGNQQGGSQPFTFSNASGLPFGQQQHPQTGSTGFGQPATSQPQSGFTGFGQPATSQPQTGFTGFGQPATSQPQTGFTGFGQPASSQPQPQTGSTAFGQPATSQPAANPVFGGFGTGSSGAFGGTPFSQQPTKGLFGATGTTPQGATQPAQTASSSFLFGTAPNTTAATTTPSTQASPLFGTAAPNSTGTAPPQFPAPAFSMPGLPASAAKPTQPTATAQVGMPMAQTSGPTNPFALGTMGAKSSTSALFPAPASNVAPSASAPIAAVSTTTAPQAPGPVKLFDFGTMGAKPAAPGPFAAPTATATPPASTAASLASAASAPVAAVPTTATPHSSGPTNPFALGTMGAKPSTSALFPAPPSTAALSAPAASASTAAVPATAAPQAPGPVKLFDFGTGANPTASGLFAAPAGTATPPATTAAPSATTASAPTAAVPTTTASQTPGPMKLSDLGTPATKPPTPALFAAPNMTAPLATTAAPPRSVGPSSSLRNKTVEQIVNDWKTQTMKYEQEFRKLAVDVGKWDLMLWKNGEELTKLTKEVEAAEETQRLIDQNLEYIESEQSQMDDALASYEAEVRKLFESDGPERVRMTPADLEREKAYGLAATLNSQFDDMTRQLSTMVEDINATLHPSGETDANGATNGAVKEDGSEGSQAYSQVVRILNHHLSSLRWLDSQVSQLDRKVGDVERYRGAAENVVSRVFNSREGAGGMSGVGQGGGFVGSASSGSDWASLRGR